VLDVTFDGRYILNNDFVSVNPVIKVRVWDENPFIRKSDTLGIRIFLAYPCAAEGCGFEKIFFSGNDVEWHAATDTSDFTAWFRPGNLVPGTYVLRVEAS